MLKPRHPKVGTWKVNQARAQGRVAKIKVTFDQLLRKYVNEKTISSDRPVKKESKVTS